MKIFRIEITSWTSSFRYSNLISGNHPTLEVPPLSTVLGLINAASGHYNQFTGFQIGYYFQFEMKTYDLETIYMLQRPNINNGNSNVVRREILFNNKLVLYISDKTIAGKFHEPVFPLLLGRSSDLATVNSIIGTDIEKTESASKIKGQIIPFNGNFFPGLIQALPRYYSDTIPRSNLGTEPFSIISCNAADFNTSIKAYRDNSIGKHGVDIYFHNVSI